MRIAEHVARPPLEAAPRGVATSEGGRVTVVIPCYNQGRFLAEAIDSVLAQSHTDHEIVVVDDGSTDDTAAVATRYPGVRLIRQDNAGLSAARNAGLAQARGEYVVFLDSDDRLLPGALEVGVGELHRHPECAFVSGRIRLIASNGSPLEVPLQPFSVDDHAAELLRYNFIWTPGAVTYRTAAVGSVGGFDSSMNATADWDLHLRIAGRHPVHQHGALVAEYRRHDASMSADPALMLRDTVAALRAQDERAHASPPLAKAQRTGLKEGRRYYGVPLAAAVRSRLRARDWKAALAGMRALLRDYPRGLLSVVAPPPHR